MPISGFTFRHFIWVSYLLSLSVMVAPQVKSLRTERAAKNRAFICTDLHNVHSEERPHNLVIPKLQKWSRNFSLELGADWPTKCLHGVKKNGVSFICVEKGLRECLTKPLKVTVIGFMHPIFTNQNCRGRGNVFKCANPKSSAHYLRPCLLPNSSCAAGRPGAAAKKRRGDEILKFGMPDRGPLVQYYKNYALLYDQTKRIPLWVAEEFTAESLQGKANRKYSRFRPDPQVAEPFRSHNSDFIGSGWSRGHMSPAGDNKYDQGAMDESFLLSNIIPQDIRNNGGFWNMFEIYCRGLTKKYSSVRVISGPAMVHTTEADGKTYIKYQLIGKHRVAVPTHLYKVILVEGEPKKPLALAAFLVPNIPIGQNRKLVEFQVPLEKLEDIVGLHFCPKLDRRRVFNLCEVEGCKFMDRNKFELFIIGKRLEKAETLNQLEKVWAEMRKKGLTPDDYVIKLYQRKKVELAKKAAEKPES